ncbi:MAG: hypothetical protein U5R31_17135 [Acidimicrobiia bacterium]|nr:hypothetical protein [Acidimicrobiia bacterium]
MLGPMVVAVGWVFTQFDSQYDATSVVGRMLIGVPVGLFAAVVYSPVSLFVAGTIGVAAGFRYSRRRPGVSA